MRPAHQGQIDALLAVNGACSIAPTSFLTSWSPAFRPCHLAAAKSRNGVELHCSAPGGF